MKEPRAPKTPMAIPRLALLAVAFLLPAASLIPLGTLWLWDHGYIVHWAIGTCLAVAGVYYLERRLIVPLPAEVVTDADVTDPGDRGWTWRQAEAWADVMRLAASVQAERMTSRDAVLGLGLEGWGTIWSQAANAGRVVKGTFLTRSTTP